MAATVLSIAWLLGTIYFFRKHGWKAWQPWSFLFIMAYLISFVAEDKANTGSESAASGTTTQAAEVGFDGEYVIMVNSSILGNVASKITVSGEEWYLVTSSDSGDSQFDSGYIRNNTLFDTDGFSRGRINEGYIEYQGIRYSKL